MNILVINHYAGAPSIGMEYRHYHLTVEWQKKGHNVLIIAASYSHLRSKQFNIKLRVQNYNIEGVNFLVLKTPEYEGNNFKRILNILSFVWRLSKQTKIVASEFRPDVVIASSTFLFDIFPAKKIAKLSGAKLVFEVHDLWPLSPMELGGYSRWHPFILAMQRAEDFAYRHSNKVISLLPKALDYMVEHGLAPEKFVYIPNGIVVEDWNTDEEIPNDAFELIQELKSRNKILIGYAGNHGIANALNPLIDAMKVLEKENVHLLLIGRGPEKENLIQRSNNLSLQNVHFISALPKTVIPSLLDKLDILYVGLQNQPVFRFGISPNKLIDYMMAGKPIIQAIQAGNDIVSEAECGITIEPENPDEIVLAVRELKSLPIESLKTMGEKGKEYCLKNHDYTILADSFLEVLKFDKKIIDTE